MGIPTKMTQARALHAISMLSHQKALDELIDNFIKKSTEAARQQKFKVTIYDSAKWQPKLKTAFENWLNNEGFRFSYNGDGHGFTTMAVCW
ncbi:hypothetical protein Q9X96_003449 [Vibrio vulnificus]|nr:hypothetical protein [Vibrio vulnificus]